MTMTISDNEWLSCEKDDRKPTKQPQEADQLVVMMLRNVTAPEVSLIYITTWYSLFES